MKCKYLMEDDKADYSKYLPSDETQGWTFAYKNALGQWMSNPRLFADKLEAKKAASRLIRHFKAFENTDFLFARVQD